MRWRVTEPRDIGINLTAAEVLAALGGTLREVRRSVKIHMYDPESDPYPNRIRSSTLLEDTRGRLWGYFGSTDSEGTTGEAYTRWRPGDRLWAREAWAYFGGDEYLYQRDLGSVHYRATFQASSVRGLDYVPGGRWRSSQQMPRWASRLALVVTGVRAELVGERWEWAVDVKGVEL